ncbi:uncharacterized protein [Asterias amurensis]|uniref:uncharacterized protein n=1 Tax=Asterias amurensis TaxID=7602 RepID=UPI003AB7C916
MALFIRTLLIVLIVKSQVEQLVEASSNQRTVSCELQTSSKIDELRFIVENYLVILDDEVRNTQDLVKELNITVTRNLKTVSYEQEETRRMVSELQVAVATNQERATSEQERATSEQEETRRMVSELQVAVATNQERATSEQEETRRMVSELQGAVSTNQERATSEHEETRRIVSELQVAVATNQERATSEQEETRRMVSELQVAASTNQERATSEQEETRRMVSELQVAVATNQETTTSELEETRRMVSELQVAASTNQERATSEQEETRRMVSELQVAVATNQETTTSELEETRRMVSELQGAVLTNQQTDTSEVQGIRRQLEQLQGSLFPLVLFFHGRLALPKDCSEIRAMGVLISGVYLVQPLGSSEAFRVYCDMETDGGGWTVFQRRQDGSVDFYLDFANYSRGFGNLEGEFWLGNDNLHRLTAQGEYELRVDLTDFDDVTGYANYDTFSIADVSDNYRLTVRGYSGNAGETLSYNNNMAFTTKDRDNDGWRSGNCVVRLKGAWWYGWCNVCNLNGRYFNEATGNTEGIRWNGFSSSLTLKRTEIKIRRKL